MRDLGRTTEPGAARGINFLHSSVGHAGPVRANPRVDVYTLPLEADPAQLDRWYEILSREERDRARRFRFAEHRRQSIICRGSLREILGSYLDREPSRILFSYNRYGKPYVAGSDIFFNLSHSGAWATLAVSAGVEIGIDIERVDPRFAREQVPERFFSPREVARLRALPASQQTAAFFRCWTRKEAYVKARGTGLSLALDSFDVTLMPGEPAAFLRGAGDWSIQDLPAPAGYAAAIVAQGSEFTVSLCAAPVFSRRDRSTALLPA